MSPDTKSADIIDMPLPTAYFASNRSKNVDVNIESNVDADFANSVDDRHSISAYTFMLAGVQLVGSLGEYMAIATATQEAFWLQFLLEEMGLNVATLIVLREDNKACITFADHPGESS